MKSLLFLLLIILCLSVALGCNSKSTLVGTWLQEQNAEFSNGPRVTVTFKDDGTFEARSSSPHMSIFEGGSYTTDYKAVTFTCNRIGMDAGDTTTEMRVGKDKSPALEMIKNPRKVRLAWEGPNKINMDPIPGPLMGGSVYDRQ